MPLRAGATAIDGTVHEGKGEHMGGVGPGLTAAVMAATRQLGGQPDCPAPASEVVARAGTTPVAGPAGGGR